MSIFPEFIYIRDANSINLPLYKEWAYDFEKNEFKTRNGAHYLVSGDEAIKIWIYKSLKSARYRFVAYSDRFGTEIEEAIGISSDRGIIQSEIERYIEEALLVHPYITSVDSFVFESEGSTERVRFKVETVYGQIEESIGVSYYGQ